MMRYQGLSPDNLPLSNGRRSHWRTCKEEDGIISSGEIDDDSTKSIPTFAQGHKGIPRFRSPSSKTQDQNFSPYTGSVPNFPPHPKTNHYHQPERSNSPVHNGDVLLQWGHRKRSRLSRSIESRAAGGMTVTTDDSSSSSSTQIQAMINVKRRSISLPTPATVPVLETKNAANANIMPPPSSLLPNTISITTTAAAAAANITSTSNGKGGSLKSSSKDTSAFVNSIRRNSEERSAGGGSGSHPPRNGGGSSRTGAAAGGGAAAAAAASSTRSKLGKRSPSKVIEKHDHNKRSITASTTTPCSSASLRGDDKVNGFMQQEQEGGGIGMNHHNIIGSAPLQEAGCSTNTTNHHDDNVNATTKGTAMTADKPANGGGGGGGEVNEWPRVYIPLTRKEKEEDFLVMKGTKLPHRPKKRPKAVDRMLQYCFPGMWLSDVTKARYEVKEKKSSTKKPKRRGLKGMESMDSDSE